VSEEEKVEIKQRARREIRWHIKALRKVIAALTPLLDGLADSITKDWLADSVGGDPVGGDEPDR
jgi:hypothetical protein